MTGARADTVPVSAEPLVDALRTAVESYGLRVRAESAAEGFLETGWFATRTWRRGGAYARNALAVVRMRFFVDDLRADEAVITAELVHRTTLDPSQPERLIEALVPPDHAGRPLLDSVIASAVAQAMEDAP
jgi:hypothetical protein